MTRPFRGEGDELRDLHAQVDELLLCGAKRPGLVAPPTTTAGTSDLLPSSPAPRAVHQYVADPQQLSLALASASADCLCRVSPPRSEPPRPLRLPVELPPAHGALTAGRPAPSSAAPAGGLPAAAELAVPPAPLPPRPAGPAAATAAAAAPVVVAAADSQPHPGVQQPPRRHQQGSAGAPAAGASGTVVGGGGEVEGDKRSLWHERAAVLADILESTGTNPLALGMSLRIEAYAACQQAQRGIEPLVDPLVLAARFKLAFLATAELARRRAARCQAPQEVVGAVAIMRQAYVQLKREAERAVQELRRRQQQQDSSSRAAAAAGQ